MHNDIKEILFSEEAVQQRVKELANELSEEYRDKCPLVICILKGAVLFMTDLIKNMDIPLNIDFMAVSSYGAGMASSGAVKILKDLDSNIVGRDMIIVEDILDTGLTLDYIVRMLEERAPKSIKICTFLLKDKTDPKVQRSINVDYVGYNVPDVFVVGYGLDFNERYRNLPYVGVLKEEVYSDIIQ